MRKQPTASLREQFMRIIIAAVAALLLALSTGPMGAQKMLDSKSKDTGQKKKTNDDKDYKSAVDRMPDQKYDPWRNMR
jgi:hypothetical protein